MVTIYFTFWINIIILITSAISPLLNSYLYVKHSVFSCSRPRLVVLLRGSKRVCHCLNLPWICITNWTVCKVTWQTEWNEMRKVDVPFVIGWSFEGLSGKIAHNDLCFHHRGCHARVITSSSPSPRFYCLADDNKWPTIPAMNFT